MLSFLFSGWKKEIKQEKRKPLSQLRRELEEAMDARVDRQLEEQRERREEAIKMDIEEIKNRIRIKKILLDHNGKDLEAIRIKTSKLLGEKTSLTMDLERLRGELAAEAEA